jgi:hypothetical protein
MRTLLRAALVILDRDQRDDPQELCRSLFDLLTLILMLYREQRVTA